jgi:hypothetical protein
MRCQPENVRTLIDAGADVNALTWFHQSPLFLAVRMGNGACISQQSTAGREWPGLISDVITAVVEAGGNDTKDLSGETAAEWLSRTRKQHDDRVLENASVTLAAASRGRKAMPRRMSDSRAGVSLMAVPIEHATCSSGRHDQVRERSDDTIAQLMTSDMAAAESRAIMRPVVIRELDVILARGEFAYEFFGAKPHPLVKKDSVFVLHASGHCGLQTGDLIVDDFGLPVTDAAAIMEGLKGVSSGKSAFLRVSRGGAVRDVEISQAPHDDGTTGAPADADPRETLKNVPIYEPTRKPLGERSPREMFNELRTRIGIRDENLPRFTAAITGRLSGKPVRVVLHWPFDARLDYGGKVYGTFQNAEPWAWSENGGLEQPARMGQVVKALLSSFTEAFPQFHVAIMSGDECSTTAPSPDTIESQCGGKRTVIAIGEEGLPKWVEQGSKRIEYLGFVDVNGFQLPTAYRTSSKADTTVSEFKVEYGVAVTDDMFRNR